MVLYIRLFELKTIKKLVEELVSYIVVKLNDMSHELAIVRIK